MAADVFEDVGFDAADEALPWGNRVPFVQK